MIAERIYSLFGKQAATSLDALNPRDPAIAKILGIGRESLAGVNVDTESALGYPAIWRGVNIIGNALLKVRPHIYERMPNNAKQRATSHKSWRVITRQANQFMSAGIFRKTLMNYTLLRGNGLGYVDRIGDGSILDMTPLLPDKSGMAVLRNGRLLEESEEVRDTDEIKYWTRVGGETRILQPEDVIHIKGLSLNGYWGVDVIEFLATSIGLGIAARNSGARFYSQGNMASGLLTAPPGLRDEQLSEFRKAINAGFSGLTKAHKFMILEEGAKFTPFTIDPDKAQVLESRQFEVREVANIIGVQAHKLGDNSQLSYNSLEQSNQEHLDDDLDPWLQVWEDEYELKCLTEREQTEDTHFVEFNRKSLVRTNLQARTERHKFEREHGISSANDILRQENMDPIGPVGDTYMIPANFAVLDNSGLPIMPAEPDPVEPEPEDNAATVINESASRIATYMMNHAVATLAKRVCKEASEASKKPAKFLAFLDRLESMQIEPEIIEPSLRKMVEQIRGDLDKFTCQPYSAEDLEQNVALAIEDIQQRAVDSVQFTLEVEAA